MGGARSDEVAAGSFAEVLMTRDVTGLDPAVNEQALFARAYAPLLELGLSGGSDRAELLRVERAR